MWERGRARSCYSCILTQMNPIAGCTTDRCTVLLSAALYNKNKNNFIFITNIFPINNILI
jgi:hypothetical protein